MKVKKKSDAKVASDLFFFLVNLRGKSVEHISVTALLSCSSVLVDDSLGSSLVDLLEDGAKLVCSGIIEGREKDVEAAMTAHGLKLCDTDTDNDWYALVFEK